MSKKNIATALGKISLNPDVSMKESLENYYRYNPDTLMPLFMLSMSVQGKLSITTDVPQGPWHLAVSSLRKFWHTTG